MTDNPLHFTETHHALLFAWITQAVFERAGAMEGEKAIRNAIIQYGRERGGRMALRARANGDVLSMANYMAYGEWQSSPGVMEQELLEKAPNARVRVSRCPWFSTWQENGLLTYGRFYCLEIDGALAAGFNPDLKIDVVGTQTNGAAQCEFVYRDAALPEQGVQFPAHADAVLSADKVKMPWDYHVGHLFKTLESVLVAELSPVGREAIEAGLAEFGRQFGQPAVQKIAAFRRVDFSRLPGSD
jgi:hypothetical protein